MHRRLLATIGIALLACAAASDLAGARTAERIPHPTGADVVVFRSESSRNGWGGEYPDAVDVTVFGDGRVVFGDGRELRVTERGLQRLLRGARDAGLLDDTDFGEALVTDQGTTVVEVTIDAGTRSVSVYALELREADRGLAPSQRTARRALRAFLHSLDGAAYRHGVTVTI